MKIKALFNRWFGKKKRQLPLATGIDDLKIAGASSTWTSAPSYDFLKEQAIPDNLYRIHVPAALEDPTMYLYKITFKEKDIIFTDYNGLTFLLYPKSGETNVNDFIEQVKRHARYIHLHQY